MIKRFNARLWQGNPDKYKQYSPLDYFVIEDESTKGYAFYQRNEAGEFIFKGSTREFDYEEELKEVVPNIRPLHLQVWTGDFNEFIPGKNRIFLDPNTSLLIDRHFGYYYIYHSSTKKIQKVRKKPNETTRSIVNRVAENCYYGGVYKTNISPDGDTDNLPAYSSENAITAPTTIEANAVYYCNEVPVKTVEALLTSGALIVSWSGGDIEDAVIGTKHAYTAKEVTVSDRDEVTPDILELYHRVGYYLIFDNVDVLDLKNNGVSITTLDGYTNNINITQDHINYEYEAYTIINTSPVPTI